MLGDRSGPPHLCTGWGCRCHSWGSVHAGQHATCYAISTVHHDYLFFWVFLFGFFFVVVCVLFLTHEETETGGSEPLPVGSRSQGGLSWGSVTWLITRPALLMASATLSVVFFTLSCGW